MQKVIKNILNYITLYPHNIHIISHNIENEDPSRKFIQMNLPRNYKNQVKNKKQKKEIVSKQNHIVYII